MRNRWKRNQRYLSIQSFLVKSSEFEAVLFFADIGGLKSTLDRLDRCIVDTLLVDSFVEFVVRLVMDLKRMEKQFFSQIYIDFKVFG